MDQCHYCRGRALSALYVRVAEAWQRRFAGTAVCAGISLCIFC